MNVTASRRARSRGGLVVGLALAAGLAASLLAGGWLLEPVGIWAAVAIASAGGVVAGLASGGSLADRATLSVGAVLAAVGAVLAVAPSLATSGGPPASSLERCALGLAGSLPGLIVLVALRALAARPRARAAVAIAALGAGGVAAVLALPRAEEEEAAQRVGVAGREPGLTLRPDDRARLEGQLGAAALEYLRAVDVMNSLVARRGLATVARSSWPAVERVQSALAALHAEVRRRVAAGAGAEQFATFVDVEQSTVAFLARAERARAERARAPAQARRRIVDALGRVVATEPAAARIVSLSPAGTELLFALGCGPRVVLRDTASSYPEAARRLPATNPFQVSVEHVAGFRPDLVLASHMDALRLRALERLELRVAIFDPATIDALARNIAAVGSLCGASERARGLVADLRARAERVAREVADRPRPRVYVETDGSDPLKPWAAGPGSLVDHLLGLAGGRNILARMQRPIAQVSAEQVLVARPDVVLLMNAEGQRGSGLERLRRRPGWGALEAVRAGRVIDSIHPDLLSRAGPRTAEGLEALARALAATRRDGGS